MTDTSPHATNNKTADSPLQNVPWMEKNQGMVIGIAFVLVIIYMIPVFMVIAAAWKTKIFQEDSSLLSWFTTFILSSTTTLGEFHKVLFPVISALSVIAIRSKPNKLMVALGAFILISFACTVYISVIFDMPSTQNALKGLETTINVDLTKAFFVRIQETLLMYFMMLLGINVANTSK